MKLIKKAWNTFWIVDASGKMIDAVIGGQRSGYVSERGREYKSLAEVKSAFLI